MFYYFNDKCFVVRTVGYYRDTTNSTYGPVRRFETTEAGTSATPANLPAASTMATHPIVAEFARGNEAATTTTNDLFYNLGGTSILVSGQIRDDGKRTYTGSVTDPKANKTAIGTYNFTITPRG